MSPLEQSRAREKNLVQGLNNLAQKFGVIFEQPLQINSLGEFNLFLAKESPPYSARMAEWLNQHNPRCGVLPGACLIEGSRWCMMNHFDVERLLLATGCINGSAREGTRYHHSQWERDHEHPAGITRLESSRIESDSGVYWLLFTDKERAKRYLEEHGEPTRTNSAHDCSGRYFDRGAHIHRETKTKTLVVIHWGHDI